MNCGLLWATIYKTKTPLYIPQLFGFGEALQDNQLITFIQTVTRKACPTQAQLFLLKYAYVSRNCTFVPRLGSSCTRLIFLIAFFLYIKFFWNGMSIYYKYGRALGNECSVLTLCVCGYGNFAGNSLIIIGSSVNEGNTGARLHAYISPCCTFIPRRGNINTYSVLS